MELVDIKLNINLASIQEGYHASWSRPTKASRRERWHTVIPFMSGEHLIGQLTVSGCPQAGLSACEAIQQLIDVLGPMEAEIVAMASDFKSENSIPASAEEATESRGKSVPPIAASHWLVPLVSKDLACLMLV